MHRTKLALGALTLLAAACGGKGNAGDTGDVQDVIAAVVPPGSTPAAGTTVACTVLVAGGGTGGIAAAIASASLGVSTCVTEETDWVGGQFTAQGLNASDDSQFTDGVGETHRFALLRSLMRGMHGNRANPGSCWVSHLCAEPAAALSALTQMTADAIGAGNLRIFYNLQPTAVTVASGKVTGVVYARTSDGGKVTLTAQQTIDATELGDVIKLSGAGYRAGQEPRSDTMEADAPEAACVDCVQSYTYDVVLEKRPSGEVNTIDKPEGYGTDPWMTGFSNDKFPTFGSGSVWSYRRIVDGTNGASELSIMNWSDGNDYPYGNILDKTPDEVATQLARARARALAYVYWLQTEADGHGYPNLKMRSDVLGTTNGVAKTPYIREGRRLRALDLVRAEDLTDFYNPGQARAREWQFSAGIGFYPVDMHKNSAEGSGWPQGKSLPFEVPLGALIPETMNGLMAGAKDIGTSHMTNSAYRLHPVEWASGEAAGTFAAMCALWKIEPREAYANEAHVRELQDRLLANGAPLYWMDDVPRSDPRWQDMQLVAAAQVMAGAQASTLHYLPNAVMTRAQTAASLVNALGLPLITPASPSFDDVPASNWAYQAIETLAAKGIITGTGTRTFSASAPVTYGQMQIMIGRATSAAFAAKAAPRSDGAGMPRGDAAVALAATYRAHMNLP